MADSNIEWTDATWNPVTGCTMVSPGCAHCYAQTVDHRFDHDKVGKLPWAFPASRGGRGVTLHPERLNLPLTWKKPKRIFVNSMSDLFHEDVPDYFIAKVFDVMNMARQHTFQILTKRADRMQEWVTEFSEPGKHAFYNIMRWPLPNVWLGVSVESQYWADRRIPLLLETPAAVRFLSCEPLLSGLDLRPYFFGCSRTCTPTPDNPVCACKGRGIHWVICGGESGPNRRPADPDWFRGIRDQCVAASVPLFHKQGNAFKPGQDRELDGRTWDEMPEVSYARA